jgi:hypothetical protein
MVNVVPPGGTVTVNVGAPGAPRMVVIARGPSLAGPNTPGKMALPASPRIPPTSPRKSLLGCASVVMERLGRPVGVGAGSSDKADRGRAMAWEEMARVM